MSPSSTSSCMEQSPQPHHRPREVDSSCQESSISNTHKWVEDDCTPEHKTAYPYSESGFHQPINPYPPVCPAPSMPQPYPHMKQYPQSKHCPHVQPYPHSSSDMYGHHVQHMPTNPNVPRPEMWPKWDKGHEESSFTPF
ncbi:hypothetical protein [Brevibacillus laterosporus]|nr:hypothetical protein [Brevibacillus laterosporus]